VLCPRCGTENEAGDRFCSSCGASLRKPAADDKERRTLRERFGGLAGPTRQARIVTALTALALLVAVAAFIALDPAEDENDIPRDAYTIEAEAVCLDAKREIIAAQGQGPEDAAGSGPGAFAAALVPVTGDWRAGLEELAVPPDRTEEAGELDRALREVQIELAQLALVPAGEGREALARAEEVDLASIRVEEAIDDLGLSACGRRAIGIRASNGG
jgi:zinc-ribbon domain